MPLPRLVPSSAAPHNVAEEQDASLRWHACLLARPTSSTTIPSAIPAMRPLSTPRRWRRPAPQPRPPASTVTNPPASPSHRARRTPATPQPGSLRRRPRPVRDPHRWTPMACRASPGRVGYGRGGRAVGAFGRTAPRRGHPRGQLIRLTRRLPVELASQLPSVLDGGPALLRAEAVRVLEAADPRDPATPPWAVIVMGWLEAAEQALTAGGSAPELRVLLDVAGQEGNLG